MRRALSRLRWQLTLSHLIAIAFTLLSMIAALLLIVSTWWSRADHSAFVPAQDARLVADAVGGLVVDGSPDLSPILRQLVSGSLRLPSGIPAQASDVVQFQAPLESALQNVAYLVIVAPDGRVLGSSDQAGAAFAPPERPEWAPLVAAAMTRHHDPARLTAGRTGPGPVALGAYPITDPRGTPVAALLIGKSALPAAEPRDFRATLLFFGAASVAVLAGASIFALASSSLVGYLLARRLVSRLERLGRAAQAFAAGDLRPRVEPARDLRRGDEVDQLGERFNAMADRLASTLAELEGEKRTVEAALQAKRELVANVSHELRTPLASIRGHTESLLLHDDVERDELRRYLDVIHRQSEQLSRLIDDLFLLSTTEAGALPLTLRPVALGEVVEDVVRSTQPAARAERGVSLVTAVAADLPAVLADRQRVAQILANLVRNAVRHTPEGGLVAVRAELRSDRLAVVSVEDTGEGIPPEELERIFERFYRADLSRDRSSGGAGLGLAIVRELVTAMGGEVEAASVVGEGSRFSFTLPFAQSANGTQGSPISDISAIGR